jgi:hypothetical protein
VFATVPYLEPAGFRGLRGNGLTTSKIDDDLGALPNYIHQYESDHLELGM